MKIKQAEEIAELLDRKEKCEGAVKLLQTILKSKDKYLNIEITGKENSLNISGSSGILNKRRIIQYVLDCIKADLELINAKIESL